MSGDSPTLSVTLLGAGQEVGRSCCVIQYRGKTVVCDAGIHPAHSGMASLPFVDELDWSTVDVILITQFSTRFSIVNAHFLKQTFEFFSFHLDHAASLTYIMEKTNFKDGKGKVYMTHPTKAVFKFLMQDFARMSSAVADPLFTPLDLTVSFPSIIPISVHQQITPCPGISFTPYHAGHVLGACMYLIDIVGLKVLYTGDYSREEDRHLVQAELPPVRPDVLITESTYGVQAHQGRLEKELRFTSLVHSIIKRGGHALLPVYALGRAQELLLILEEYWIKHPELHNVPIYYASSLARKCMAVFQTYIHTMNANIRGKFARRENPFMFKHVSHLPQSRGGGRKLADGPPCVVLATPGMLQSGLSRELLEYWAPDARNGLVVTGYSVEGTLAREIMNEPEEITTMKGNTIPRNCSVDYISFSAHVDGAQNEEFIDLIKAQHVILVHGEQGNMSRLRTKLQHKYKERNEDIKIHTPRNLETLKLSFRGERVAKAIGILANNVPNTNDVISGLLVSKDYSYTLLDARDLGDFAGLSTSIVTQRQLINVEVSWDLIRWHLESMFGRVVEGMSEDKMFTLRVMRVLDVKKSGQQQVTLEWESSASNDMVADSALALILGIDSSPASIKLASHSCKRVYSDKAETAFGTWLSNRAEQLQLFLVSHFGEVGIQNLSPGRSVEDSDSSPPSLLIHGDSVSASINILTLDVSCENDAMKSRIERVIQLAITTIDSLDDSFKPIVERPSSTPAQTIQSDGIVDNEQEPSPSVLGKRRMEDREQALAMKADAER